MAENYAAAPAKKMEKCALNLRSTMKSGCAIALASACLISIAAHAQVLPLERLSGAGLDLYAPDQRVSGTPGEMTFDNRSCEPREVSDIRRRIVDIAVQEWAFFGFSVVDQTGPQAPFRSGSFVRRPWMDPTESARVASSIAGYWSVTPDGDWILERQNNFWQGPLGVGERWRDPWSAAFISWTMCEAGFSEFAQFRRSINHRTYIDQAIHSRDANVEETAFVAYDVGEKVIEPGDLVCTARRHGYRTLDDRRRHLGEGARTHCDIVVHVDAAQNRVLGIGGNVRGRVSLKLIYAVNDSEDPQLHSVVGRENRSTFAHLKLSAATSERTGLLHTPSMRKLANDPKRRAALEALLGMELGLSDDS